MQNLYFEKYNKYKQKYLLLKNQIGGANMAVTILIDLS